MKPQKKSKVLAMISMLLAIIMLTMGFTTACQPSPEKPVVIGKGDGSLESIIAAAPEAEKLVNPYETPSKLEYKLESTDTFFVDVHADVFVPVVDAYPVITTQSDTITQKQADRIMKVLLEGKPLYWANEELTKEQIQSSIDYYRKKLEGIDAQEIDPKIKKSLVDASGDYLSPDALSPEEQKDLYKEKIKELLKAYEAAPDSMEQKPAKMKFDYLGLTKDEIKEAKAQRYLSIQGVTPLEPGKRQMALYIGKYGDSMAQVTFEEYKLEGLSYPYSGVDEITLEQAIQQGQQLIENLGLDFSLVQSYTTNTIEDGEYYAWHELTFKRRINGVSQNNVFYVNQHSQDEYYITYEDEFIQISIDDYGLRSFFWNDPSKLVNVENPNIPLLPFDEVQKIFDRQIVLMNQWGYPEEEVISRRLVIDHVELSYMKVRKPNDEETFIYLPVWDFYGKLMAKYGEDYPSGTKGYLILDENNERVEIGNYEEPDSVKYISFMTINAIDGSIIDRDLGY